MTRTARAFSDAFLSDPAFYAVNRLPAHSDHHWYADAQEALMGRSSFDTCLNGTWKYYHCDAPGLVPEGLEDPRIDVSAWDDIPVPAHIQLQGYDRPQYVNVQYPWDGLEAIDPPQIPTRFNPVSTYAKDVVLAPLDEVEGLRLVIDGAESACALWVNGHFVGFATDSFTPSEFDIAPYVAAGTNRIVIRVWKWCWASWLEDQDFFRFSGLFRSVSLRRIPPAHIEDLAVRAIVTEDCSNARLEVDVRLSGSEVATATIRPVLVGVGPLARRKDGAWRLDIPNVRLWSAEYPHLYDLLIEVRSAKGSLLEVVPYKVGFRRFAIEEGLLRINGRRAVLKGINRHESGPRGRVMTRDEIAEDLRALKRLGVNAVRTSHYPNSSPFYELCDELGLYVVDEVNLETHGMWDRIIGGLDPIESALPGDREEWAPAIMDRADSMILRDRNHPCVVIWSLGNEAFGGRVLKELADHVHSLDPRPVHYEGVHADPRYPETTDIASQMYTSPDDVADYLASHRDKPFILCEYAHAMGHSLGTVDRYIDLMRRDDLFQGAFVWDYADQSLRIDSEDGQGAFGYGGDFGDAPHDGEFCGNGVFFADHTPTPKAQELAHLYQGLRTNISLQGLRIENEYAFTSASDFICRVRLAREASILEARQLRVGVEPGHSEIVPLPFPAPHDPGEYTITVEFLLRDATSWAPAGTVIARDQRVFEIARAAEPIRSGAEHEVELIEGRHNIGVRGHRFQLLFSTSSGGIQSFAVGDDRRGRELLRGTPTVNFWHAPTANERGWGAPAEDGQWLLASRYARTIGGLTAFRTSRVDGALRIEWELELPTVPRGLCFMSIEARADGRIDWGVIVHPGEGLPPPPEFGILFALNPNLHRLRWYGDGPEETSIDRRGGALLGVYEADVAEQFTPYLRPQESGGHTGVRWAELSDVQGMGIRFEAPTPVEFSALRWSPFEIENAAHIDELPKSRRTWARIMAMRRGAGGNDSWGARPLPECQLPTGPLEFHFSFMAVTPSRAALR